MFVGVFEAVGVLDGVAVEVAVEVAVGVSVGVKVNVCVAVCVTVGVKVDGKNGVFVVVGVGVSEAVPVRIFGVVLTVGDKMLSVSVTVAVIGVFVGVAAMAFGSEANCTAIQPRQ